MSNIETDAKKTAADAKTAVKTERRRLVARLLDALSDHPHTVLAVAAAAVVLAVTFGLLRG